MNTLQLSIVHRLPQSYRWSAGFAGSKVEPIPQSGANSDNCLVALKLLSPEEGNAWPVMEKLSQALTDIERLQLCRDVLIPQRRAVCLH